MIRFSVVIPAYQSAATIITALRSVQAQTYPAFEIIVVDDAGNDELNNELLRSGVVHALVRHESNRGVSAARNTGWELASGDYVAFLDSDDAWCPEKLHSMAQILADFPDAALIGHSFSTEECVPLQGSVVARRKCVRDFVWKNLFQGSSIICRRNLPLRFEPELRYSEDFDLALQVAASGLAVYFSASVLTRLGRAQQSKGGLSSNRRKMRLGEMRAYARLAKAHAGWFFAVPFLLVFSLVKHLRPIR